MHSLNEIKIRFRDCTEVINNLSNLQFCVDVSFHQNWFHVHKIWFRGKWLNCHTVYVWVSKSWQHWLYIPCWCLSQQWQIFWRPFIFIFFRHLPPDVNQKRETWLYPSLGLSLTAFEKLYKLFGFSRKKSIKGRTLKKQKVTRHTHSNILNWTQPQVSRESTEEKKGIQLSQDQFSFSQNNEPLPKNG